MNVVLDRLGLAMDTRMHQYARDVIGTAVDTGFTPPGPELGGRLGVALLSATQVRLAPPEESTLLYVLSHTTAHTNLHITKSTEA